MTKEDQPNMVAFSVKTKSVQEIGRLKCDHCHKIGRVKEKCWRLNGYSRGKKVEKPAGVVGMAVTGQKEVVSSHLPSPSLAATVQQGKLKSIACDDTQASSHIVPSLTQEEYQQLIQLLKNMKGMGDTMSGKTVNFNSVPD